MHWVVICDELIQHFLTRVDAIPLLVGELAEVQVIDIAFLRTVEIIKASELVLQTYLHLERFESTLEFIEAEAVIKVEIKVPKCLAERVKPLFDSNPDEFESPALSDFILTCGTLQGCWFRLRV